VTEGKAPAPPARTRLRAGAGARPRRDHSRLLRLSAGCHEARLRHRAQARVKAATNTGSFGYLPPAWCEAHHITPWSQGGESNLSESCLLCAFHHHLAHGGEWHVTMSVDGIPEVIPPPHIDPLQRSRRHERFRYRRPSLA